MRTNAGPDLSKFSAVHDPCNDIQIIKTSLLKSMPPMQTTADTAFIFNNVMFPRSFSVLKSRQTIGCPRDTSQARLTLFINIFIVKCKHVRPWTFVLSLFEIIFPLIWINLFPSTCASI